jgi:hypothetical protein
MTRCLAYAARRALRVIQSAGAAVIIIWLIGLVA